MKKIIYYSLLFASIPVFAAIIATATAWPLKPADGLTFSQIINNYALVIRFVIAPIIFGFTLYLYVNYILVPLFIRAELD